MNTLMICPSCEKMNRVDLKNAAKASPLCGSCKVELPLYDGVQDIGPKALSKLLKMADRPIVVDFWAEWCGPCRTFAPTFKRAAQELASQMVFAKLNTEIFPEAGQAYQIRGIPTLIVFKGGREVGRQSGAMSFPEFREYLAQWM